MDYVCPDSHNLESWGDAHPSYNTWSLVIDAANYCSICSTLGSFRRLLLKWLGLTAIIIVSCLIFGVKEELIGKEAVHDGFFHIKDRKSQVTSIAKLNENVLSRKSNTI